MNIRPLYIPRRRVYRTFSRFYVWKPLGRVADDFTMIERARYLNHGSTPSYGSGQPTKPGMELFRF